MTRRGRTFASRVASAMTLTAALSATLSAALAVVIADRWMLARHDDRLADAVTILAQELAATPGTDDDAARVADDEDVEVRPTGVRVAIYRGARRLGGDPSLALPVGLGCETVTREGGPWRRCVVPHGRWRVVVMGDLASQHGMERVLVGASLVACVVAVLAALAMSRRVSEAIVRPLARLRERVAGVDAGAPGRASLGEPEGYDEIDVLRATLGELLTRLDAALSQSRRFAADAAHELRTPLTTALGEIEWASSEDATQDDVKRSLERAHRTLASLRGMVERLLILASPLEGARLTREAVAVADVIEEVRASLDETSRARLALAVDEDAYVRGDAALLRVMLTNAAGNALKFAPEGAVELGVTTTAAEVMIRVRDHGPGVGASERERVFEPFHRTASARGGSVPGHGIGLALVGHIARAHGGGARFEDVGEGALLVIRLPAYTSAEAG